MHAHTLAASRRPSDTGSVSVRYGHGREGRLRRRSVWASLPARIGLFALAAVILTGGVAALMLRSAAADVIAAQPAVAPAPPIAPRPLWLDIVKPIQLYELAGSEFGRLPLDYTARRRPEGRERQDTLSFGQFGTDAPYVRLSIRRIGGEPAETPDFFVGLVRLAGEGDLAVTKSGLPTPVRTRFGDFATADVTLSHGSRGAPCLGFRLDPSAGTQTIGIAGLACGGAAKPMDRATLSCLLDRIDLVSAGDDEPMRAFFVDAERRRGQECSPSRLVAAGSRQTWLDSEAHSPALRHANAPGRLR